LIPGQKLPILQGLMDLEKVIAQLRAELVSLDAAIRSLEQLPQGKRRRGRPPGWLTRGRKIKGMKRKPRNKPGDE
jgi:hypothetical protein